MFVRSANYNALAIALLLPLIYLSNQPYSAAAQQPGSIPEFSLKDPLDTTFTQDSFKDKGVVFIVTIPNVKHGDQQSRWKNWLTRKDWPKDKYRLVMIEDLSQSAHKDKALEGMKEKYKAGQDTVLLIDHDSSVRKKFLVPQDETRVLVYDKSGKLIYATQGEATIEESRKIYKLLTE